MRLVALAVGATIVLVLYASQTLPAAAPQAPAPRGDTAPAHRAVLNRYCVSCHNERNKANAGRLALDSVDLSRVGEHAEVWEKVVRKLRAGLMPPPGRPRPDPPRATARRAGSRRSSIAPRPRRPTRAAPRRSIG